MKIRPNNVKLTQIWNSGLIKPNRWKHTKDKQLSGMEENNDSSGVRSREKPKFDYDHYVW